MPVGVVILGLGVLALVAYVYASQPKRQEQQRDAERAAAEQAARESCADLENRLLAASGQGADVQTLAAIAQEYQACARRTGAVAEWVPFLAAATAKRTQVEQEFAHYRSTGWVDTLKRNNTRGTWLRLADGWMRDVRDAIQRADNALAFQIIRREMDTWREAAVARSECFRTHGAGCGRCAECLDPEPDQGTRALQEWERSLAPLIGADASLAHARQFAWQPEAALAASGPGLYAALDAKEAELRAKFVRAAAQAVPLAAGGSLLGSIQFGAK